MLDIYTPADNFAPFHHVTTKEVLPGTVQAPEWTVFVPTYRRTDTLRDTLQSILSQETTLRFEILVISNDPEAENGPVRSLLEELHDPRIRFGVNAENIGLCGNWNRGVEWARGKYVTMIHDDDVLSPYCLETLRQIVPKQEEAAIIGVDAIRFDSRKKPVFPPPSRPAVRYVSKRSFFFGKYIQIAGMTVHREKMLSLGGYREEYYPNEDTILIYQGILRYEVINIEHPLAGYRQEVNLSLNEEVMKKIILLTEETRRQIASHEEFARKWMKHFDREFLYQYISSANAGWGLSLDHRELMRACGLPEKKPWKLKIKGMNWLIDRQLKKEQL